MTTYYVATLARYVLVDAANKEDAVEKGRQALHALYPDIRERLGQEVPINIKTVRLATNDEFELLNWRALSQQIKIAGGTVRLAGP